MVGHVMWWVGWDTFTTIELRFLCSGKSTWWSLQAAEECAVARSFNHAFGLPRGRVFVFKSALSVAPLGSTRCYTGGDVEGV